MDVSAAQTAMNVRHADQNLSLTLRRVLVMNFAEMEENLFMVVTMETTLMVMVAAETAKLKLGILA